MYLILPYITEVAHIVFQPVNWRCRDIDIHILNWWTTAFLLLVYRFKEKSYFWIAHFTTTE